MAFGETPLCANRFAHAAAQPDCRARIGRRAPTVVAVVSSIKAPAVDAAAIVPQEVANRHARRGRYNAATMNPAGAVVTVKLADTPYDIAVRPGLLSSVGEMLAERLKARKAAIV